MANEHSQIVPSMQPTAKVADFKFWCQKVLPLVYDDSLSYYEVLNKMVVYLNQVIDNINANIDNIDELEDDFLLLQTYVNNFFDDIDQLATYAERAEAAETSAIGYAASAAESASNSATSASNAAGSASTAASMATSALDAKDAAIAAKTAAETALANAQTAATNAANSATAAGTSETNAASSALSASGSATNAAASATAAQQSFTLADAARSAAQSAASDAEDSAEEAQQYAQSGIDAQDMIASEDETTATAAHSKGSYFRIDDTLYIATADISIGDTITAGTNCTAVTVGQKLKDNADAIASVLGIAENSYEKVTLTNPTPPYFTDGAGDTTLNLVMDIPTRQTGTGTPSSENVRNISPITDSIFTVGVRGKNLIGYQPKLYSENSRYFVLRSGITASSVTSCLTIPANCKVYVKVVAPSSPGAKWSIHGSWIDSRSQIDYSALGTGLTRTFTITNSRNYSRGIGLWGFCQSGGTFSGHLPTMMITYIDYADYEEYKTINYNYTLPEALQNIVCGGSLNANTGELIVTRKYIASYNNEELPGFWVSSMDVYAEGTTPTVGAQVAYELETPETYQLESYTIYSYEGENSIYGYWCKVETLEYYKLNNTTSLVTKIESIIAPVLTEMVADTNLVENDFRIVNDRLYRITTNVASGAELIPDTNCVATTVAAQLKILRNA